MASERTELRCVMCGVLVEPSSGGLMVGWPVEHPMCGRHVRAIEATFRWAMSRRPRKGQPDFYAHAGTPK